MIGCGISGATVAYQLRNAGLEVAVFERSPTPGIPVRCGCGFSENCFEPLGIPFDGKWLIERVDGVRLFTPSLYEYHNEITKGYILAKDLLIHSLLSQARSQGIHFFPSTKIVDVERGRGGKYIITSIDGKKYRTGILADCSGFTSPVRRYLGLEKIPTLGAVRYLFPVDEMKHITLGKDRHPGKRYLDFLFDPKIFQGGYGWIFPMGGEVQLGAVTRGNPARALKRFFVEHGMRLPEPTSVTGGRIPYKGPERRLVHGGILLLGESASLVNPMNFSGNYSGMLGATVAADVIIRYFEHKKIKRKGALGLLNAYEERMRAHPSQSPLLIQGAHALYSLGPKALDLLGMSARRNGKEGLSVGKLVFRLILNPSMLKETGKLRQVGKAMPNLWKNGW